jgi:hypothetical protein
VGNGRREEDRIHIIEPTLESEAGHCHSFVESLCRAAARDRPTAAKEDGFRRLAGKQPNIVILAPTPSVGNLFSRCGFAHTKMVPYPITPRADFPDDASTGFRHLLFAGAARQDKGFSAMVDLVGFLDGVEGIVISATTALLTFTKYAKLREPERKRP